MARMGLKHRLPFAEGEGEARRVARCGVTPASCPLPAPRQERDAELPEEPCGAPEEPVTG